MTSTRHNGKANGWPQRRVVGNPTEWQALTPLECPTISIPSDQGAVHHVEMVGFVGAPISECRALGIVDIEDDGTIPLPFARIKLNGETVLRRLPVPLNEWAMSIVGTAQSGTRLLPCDIEFGIIEGRHYAEML